MGILADNYPQQRTTMILLHTLSYAICMLLFTFYPNCPSSSPCYFPAITGMVLYAFSFVFW